MVVQQHKRATVSWVTAAVISLTATVCGCSTGARADHRLSAEAGATVRAAADRLVRAGSSKARTSMEMASGGTRVTIRGAGVYDYRERVGRLRVLLPEDPAGPVRRRTVTELLAPGALYMKNRGAGVPADKWVRVETAGLSDGNLVTGGATDPLAAAELLRGARGVTYVGATEVAGAKVRHYRGTVDLARAARAASSASRASLAAAAEGVAEEEVPFDVYLDEEGRVRKVRHRFRFADGDGDGGGGGGKAARPVAVASTTLLYAFGEPVRVRLPADGDIFTGRIAEGAADAGG